MTAYSKPKNSYISPVAYLEREQDAETKSEYCAGEIVAMAGASPEHNAITFELTLTLGVQLRKKPCQGFGSDQRVAVRDAYYYPDLIVVCGEPLYASEQGGRASLLLNPSVLVEVLSASTEARDRGEKWLDYQALDSLQHYVLVSQNAPLVEVYTRRGKEWLYSAYMGLESVVSLEAIGCELPLSEIYARVVFPLPLEPETEGEV